MAISQSTSYDEMSRVMTMVCKTAAKAVHRYAEVSGLTPGWDMPEPFITGYIFDRLNLPDVSMTLESNFKKLWDWNEHGHQRQRSRPAPKRDKNERVDLALFKGNSEDPGDHPFFALIEFKRFKLNPRDREKLLGVFKHIDTCPWGAICSVLLIVA